MGCNYPARHTVLCEFRVFGRTVPVTLVFMLDAIDDVVPVQAGEELIPSSPTLLPSLSVRKLRRIEGGFGVAGPVVRAPAYGIEKSHSL